MILSVSILCIIVSRLFPFKFRGLNFLTILWTNDNLKDTNVFQNIQSILDHNTIFLPIILDLKHNKNSFQNLTRNMKSFKTVLEKEKRNNVYLSQTADMAVIEFNQTFFMNFEKHFPLQKNKNARKVPLNQFMTKELLSLRAQKQKNLFILFFSKLKSLKIKSSLMYAETFIIEK